jgi:hypothetical protein
MRYLTKGAYRWRSCDLDENMRFGTQMYRAP